jgi:hypothetical protein
MKGYILWYHYLITIETVNLIPYSKIIKNSKYALYKPIGKVIVKKIFNVVNGKNERGVGLWRVGSEPPPITYLPVYKAIPKKCLNVLRKNGWSFNFYWDGSVYNKTLYKNGETIKVVESCNWLPVPTTIERNYLHNYTLVKSTTCKMKFKGVVETFVEYETSPIYLYAQEIQDYKNFKRNGRLIQTSPPTATVTQKIFYKNDKVCGLCYDYSEFQIFKNNILIPNSRCIHLLYRVESLIIKKTRCFVF